MTTNRDRFGGGPLLAAWSFARIGRREAGYRIVNIVLIAASLAVAGACLGLALRWLDRPFPGFLVNPRMVVGNLGLPDWTGTQAGLASLDKIVSAEGAPVASAGDLDRIVGRSGVGRPVRYLVSRGPAAVELVIPTMRFSTRDLLLTFGVFFVLGIAYVVLGIVVFLLKPDGPVSRVFLVASLVQGLSLLITFDLESSHAGFVWLTIFCDAVMPALALHLSFHFPDRWRVVERHPWLTVLPYIPSLALLILMEASYPRPFYFRVYWWAFLYLFLAAMVFLGAALSAYLRGASPLGRQRAKIVLLSAALAFPIPVIAPWIASVGGAVGGMKILTNLTTLPVLVFPFAIAYSIARHNLFDVDVFIKRTVGYAIMTVLVGASYLGLQVGLETVVFAPVFGAAARKVTPMLFAFLVVFLFNTVNRRVQDSVDRMFYRKRFDYKETVLSVSDALSSVLEMKEIVRKVVHTVRDTMFIDTSGLILAGANGQTLRAHFVGDAAQGPGEAANAGTGAGNGREREETIPADDPLAALVARERRLITKYDVAEDPRFAGVRETCGKRFEELGASLAVPLVHKGEWRGMLAVGHKKSGRFFTREDVELLQTLASQGAVAIENARMAEQMRREEVVRTNLSRYLSPQIVDGIVKNDVQVNLGGARKVVTVLFSDIRNFTAITESRPPDQLVRILNEYFSAMAEVIFSSGGSLDKYIGDAIVAVFGSLIPLESPERSAAATAIGMMRRLDELNRRWEARDGFSMTMGIGIATGEVFLGNIGSPDSMEFTVIGDTVNVASRFSGLARSGQILVTKAVASGLGADFRRKELPPAQVKGKAEKLDVHEVLYSVRPEAP